MRFFATSPRALEQALIDELHEFSASSIKVTRAGANFEGPLDVAYRVCLWSRIASRVLLPIARFSAPTAEALYAGVYAIDWREHVAPAGTIAVDGVTAESAVHHSKYVALKTKDALVDRLRAESGTRPSVDPEHPDVRINVRIHRDTAIVSIDLSGESLHRRGYRDAAGIAPLKENLAAGLLWLARWPTICKHGGPFLDPMCGSGTLPIEAALIATDTAPNLRRQRFGFHGWRGHDDAAWQALLREAHERARQSRDKLPPTVSIVGYDEDAAMVRTALANVERAGMRGVVHIERRSVAAVSGLGQTRGLVVTNPPHGRRLDAGGDLAPLYADLGNTLQNATRNWRAYVLVGPESPLESIGLPTMREFPVWTGATESRFVQLDTRATRKGRALADADSTSSAQSPAHGGKPRARASPFANRLRKNLQRLQRWAKQRGITCYRVYDADIPEYAAAIDLYERWVHIREYTPPSTVDAKDAAARLEEIVQAVPEVLELPASNVYVQAERQAERARSLATQSSGSDRELYEARENGYSFAVKLDRWHSGLALAERDIRALLGSLAGNRDFLHLYCFAAPASVYAAKGQSRTTTSVDASEAYLDWARRNFELNRLPLANHRLVHAESQEWLSRQTAEYGLIYLAPPASVFTQAESEARGQPVFAELIRNATSRLTADGILIFSTAVRQFRLSTPVTEGFYVDDITNQTIPSDFSRRRRLHRVWQISRS